MAMAIWTKPNGALVIFRKEPAPRVLEVEHTDHFAFVYQGTASSERVSGFAST